jgi:putative tricarboxylic transport membrane protein
VLKFGPPEYFALMCLGMTIVTYLAKGSTLKAVVMTLVGLILGAVGTDVITGAYRFSLGIPELTDGIGVVPLAMGIFGIAEVLSNLEQPLQKMTVLAKDKIGRLLPSKEDWQRSAGPITRGSILGFLLGILPGGGTIISSFASYSLEKRLCGRRAEFGRGAIEGVAGPETANNAAVSGAFVPFLALGIPPNVVMAVLFGALIIHGVTPGPNLVREHPEVFFGVVASMYVGNVMLLVLNLPLIGLWVKVLKVPARILFPLILLFTLIGAYGVQGNVFDVLLMVFFGAVGYLLRKFGYEEAPLLLAFILEPLLEQSFRQSLLMSGGDFSTFVTRPICAVTLLAAAILLGSTALGSARRYRERLTTQLDNQD